MHLQWINWWICKPHFETAVCNHSESMILITSHFISKAIWIHWKSAIFSRKSFLYHQHSEHACIDTPHTHTLLCYIHLSLTFHANKHMGAIWVWFLTLPSLPHSYICFAESPQNCLIVALFFYNSARVWDPVYELRVYTSSYLPSADAFIQNSVESTWEFNQCLWHSYSAIFYKFKQMFPQFLYSWSHYLPKDIKSIVKFWCNSLVQDFNSRQAVLYEIKWL